MRPEERIFCGYPDSYLVLHNQTNFCELINLFCTKNAAKSLFFQRKGPFWALFLIFFCVCHFFVVILRRILREYARVFMRRNDKIGFYY